MGWSATAKACDTERQWSDACREQTGSSNSYKANGNTYFYDIGREQRDGAITGQVFRMSDTGYATRAGTFRIEADGTVTRYPVGIKQLITNKESK